MERKEHCAFLTTFWRLVFWLRPQAVNLIFPSRGRLNRPVRVLFVTYAFPPFGEVGSVRVAHFCRYLSNYGVEPIVLSVQEKFYKVCDYTMSVPPNIRVLRTAMIRNPLDWYGSLSRSLKSSSSSSLSVQGKTTHKQKRFPLRDHIVALLQFPDRHWGWYLPAIRAAERFVHEEGVDAIFSSGPPWISQVIALALKKKLGVPWIADFRDPWASLVPRRGPAWAHTLSERLEANCMRHSDLVLCNTDRLRRAFQEHYSKLGPTKFRTLTNGFESLSIPRIEKPHSKRLLLHLGSIYGLRRIDTFLAALSDLVSSKRLSPETFQVVLQGNMSPSLVGEAVRMVPDLLQKKCIEFRSRMSWTEAHNLLWQADLLLLFQGSHELQVPSKFYEYLQTGIPIFAITEEGALTDILLATEAGLWANSGNPQEIAEVLLKVLQLPRRTPEYVRNRFSGQYHYSALAELLSLWIREITDLSAKKRTIGNSHSHS